MSWTMIIMLSSVRGGTAQAITTVPGFISAKACTEAAVLVTKNKLAEELRAVCVEVQKQ